MDLLFMNVRSCFELDDTLSHPDAILKKIPFL